MCLVVLSPFWSIHVLKKAGIDRPPLLPELNCPPPSPRLGNYSRGFVCWEMSCSFTRIDWQSTSSGRGKPCRTSQNDNKWALLSRGTMRILCTHILPLYNVCSFEGEDFHMIMYIKVLRCRNSVLAHWTKVCLIRRKRLIIYFVDWFMRECNIEQRRSAMAPLCEELGTSVLIIYLRMYQMVRRKKHRANTCFLLTDIFISWLIDGAWPHIKLFYSATSLPPSGVPIYLDKWVSNLCITIIIKH